MLSLNRTNRITFLVTLMLIGVMAGVPLLASFLSSERSVVWLQEKSVDAEDQSAEVFCLDSCLDTFESFSVAHPHLGCMTNNEGLYLDLWLLSEHQERGPPTE